MCEDHEPGKPKPMDLVISDFDAIVNQSDADKAAPEERAREMFIKRDCAKLNEKKWLFEKRLEYARYFFDHHAKQRMSMFNYFLLLVGFVVAGYATLLRGSDNFVIASCFAGAGAVLTIFFVFLERRNEELVHIAEDVLECLEKDVLFKGYDRRIQWPRRRSIFGHMRKTSTVRKLGIFRRQAEDQKCEPDGDGRSLYEHGRWMPIVQYCTFWMFVGMVIFAALHIHYPGTGK